MTAAIGYATIATGLLATIGFLWRIAWASGRLIQRFDDHAKISEEIHKDLELRIRRLEQNRGWWLRP